MSASDSASPPDVPPASPAWQVLAPGALVCAALGSAIYLAGHGFGIPALLVALIAGMALRFAVAGERAPAALLAPGLAAMARPMLRLGVALMGFRIAFADLETLGWSPVLVAAGATTACLAGGYGLARLVGLGRTAAILSAAAVAICGASAAVAVAAVLARRDPEGARTNLVAVVAAVTVIGFAVALLLPAAGTVAGLSEHQIAVLAGASIHEVAQVVASGGLMSPDAAAAATLVKMVRVAMLPLVVAALVVIEARAARAAARDCPMEATETGAGAPVPLFLIGFILAVLAANSGLIPAPVLALLVTAANLMLAAAMVAVGAETSIKGLTALGTAPLVALGAQTVVILTVAAVLVLALVP